MPAPQIVSTPTLAKVMNAQWQILSAQQDWKSPYADASSQLYHLDAQMEEVNVIQWGL